MHIENREKLDQTTDVVPEEHRANPFVIPFSYIKVIGATLALLLLPAVEISARQERPDSKQILQIELADRGREKQPTFEIKTIEDIPERSGSQRYTFEVNNDRKISLTPQRIQKWTSISHDFLRQHFPNLGNSSMIERMYWYVDEKNKTPMLVIETTDEQKKDRPANVGKSGRSFFKKGIQ